MVNTISPLTGSFPATHQVVNETGSPILGGSLVYLSGYDADSGLLTITPATNTGLATLAQFLLADQLADEGIGSIADEGVVVFDTHAAVAGDPVYLGTGGALTLTAPANSANTQIVGRVLTVGTGGLVHVYLRGRSGSPSAFATGPVVPTKWTYDFSVLGGAAGTIALTGPTLPVGSVIVAGFLDIITALDSGGSATAAVTVQGVNDVVTATAFGSSPWSAAARKAIIPVWSDMTKAIKVASTAKTPSIVIAAADLIAGKFNLFLISAVST